MLREEVQLLQEPGSYVGEVVKVMGKTKVLVKVGFGLATFFSVLGKVVSINLRVRLNFPEPEYESMRNPLL
jgi:ATP-dependent 26S proteasome regulatory subunit